MKRIAPLRISDRATLFVEMEEVDEDIVLPRTTQVASVPDLPPGAEAVSAVSNALDAFALLQTGLGDIVSRVEAALADAKPSTWKLEINIGFKGKTSPVPVILSGQAEAALKLQLEWK